MDGDFDATLAALAGATTELKGLEAQHEEIKAEAARIQAKLTEIEKAKTEKKAQIGVLVTKLQLTQAKPESVAKPKSLNEIQAEQAKDKQTKAKPIELVEPTSHPNPTIVRFHKCKHCNVGGCQAPHTHESYLHNVRDKEVCKKCDAFGSTKKRTDHLHEWCTTAAFPQCALCVKRGYDNVRWTQEECHSHKFNL